MKNLSFLRHLVFCCLMLMGTTLPALTWAVTINGDINVCKGETATYTPATPLNPNYSYTWTVTPAANGTVLTGNSFGANIQWNIVGAATVNLTGRNPALPGNPVVETGTLNVTVHNLPTPYITSNVMLACQPLNVDSIREGQPRPPVFDDENCQLVCSYSTVVYTANGTGGSTYTWNITGAISFTASGNTCTVNWGAPGNGQVKVTETTTPGCQGSASFCVEIVESPIAKFESVPASPDPITICKDGEVVLQDLSTGTTASPIVSWLWDWGDGQVSTTSPGGGLNPISHQYTVPGDYVIKLTVTNSCGCTSTYARRVRVLAPVAPKIACPRVVCERERSVYTVDIPCAASSWSVIGGTIVGTTPNRLDVVWDNVDPNTGFGYVMYRACNPCPMIVTEAVPVILQRANIQGPVVICVGEQYVYRLPKWPATEFDWFIVSGPATLNPTDQRNEKALTATGPGTVVLGCRYRNTVLGCKGETQLTIQVLPQAVISGDDLFCQGETRSYNIGGLSGSWTLMNATNTIITTGTGTTFNYTFSVPGTYKLGVTGTTFCPPEQFIIKVVPTPAPPNVITGPDSACAGIPTLYEAGNPVAGTSFQWSVSGGGTVNAALGDESYISFAGSPPYTVSVRRITLDEAQCLSAPLTKVVVSPVPGLVITGEDSACHSTQETYTLNYAGGDVYTWTISPSTLGSVVQGGATNQPTILWNIPPGSGANATITVAVTKCGVNNFKSYTVFVKGTPTVNVTLAAGQNDTVCSGTPITFTVNPSYPITSATSTGWQWGDGPLVTTPGFTSGPPYNFTHTYITDGNSAPVGYTPSVTIINANGCIGSVNAIAPQVIVMPRPIALVSPSGPLVHCGSAWSETLNATITTGIGGSNTFNWSPSGSGPTITTSTYGNYSVTVTNSIFGCSSTSNVVSIIQNCGPGPGCGTPPTVTLNATKNCNTINVTASVVGATTGFSWSYPPGFTPSGAPIATNINGTVTAAGMYTFGYTVFYTSGSTSCQYTQYINVTVPYLPNLRYEISCNQPGSNYKVTLYDNSTLYPPGSVITRNYYNASWGLIGSGATATAFVAGGTTAVFHEIIQGGANPPCTSTVSVVIPSFPVASFNLLPGIPNPGCEDDVAFNFNNTSTPTVPPLSCLWNFGDFSTNMIYHAGKVYSNPFSGPVTLTVKDQYGCVSTASMGITAIANPYSGNMTAAPNPTCQGNPVTLSFGSTGTSTPTTYTWYEQSNPLSTTATSTYNVFAPGGYWVRVGNQSGCYHETNLVSVNVKQVPPISINGDNTQCINSAFTLSTQTFAGATYVWTRVGFGTVGTGTSISQTLTTAGSYTYRVTMTYNGCTRTSPDFIVVVSNPPAPPSISFNIMNCNPYQVQLTASGAAGMYNWNNGMNGPVINTSYGGPYQVTLTALNGCQSESSIYVPKDPAEYLWVFPTGCFCRLQIERPYVIGPIIPFSYWAWIKNGGVDQSGGGYMPDYYVFPGNIYNMLLDNGYCSVTSGDMHFESDTCRRLPARPGTTGLNEFELEGDHVAMQLLPNPARDQVTVVFRFANSGGSKNIEMYDMIGRKLQSHAITEEEGRIVLPFERIAAGMYQIVMRQDGKVVQQGKLSVTK